VKQGADPWLRNKVPELRQKRGPCVVSGGGNQLDSQQFFWLECNVEIAMIVGSIVLVISLITGITIFFINKLNSRT
jgi:hypothetical protein